MNLRHLRCAAPSIALLALPVTACNPARHLVEHPQPGDLHTIVASGSQRPCFHAYIYDGSDDEKRYFQEALQEVCNIFVDPAFLDRVEKRGRWYVRLSNTFHPKFADTRVA